MASDIFLFPKITEELLSKVRFEPSKYEFYYTNNDEEFNLQDERIDDSLLMHKITDSEGIWTPDDFNLCIRRNISIRTYQYLFGTNGVICSNGTLGIALMWTSSDSRQRGIVEIGELKNQNLDFEGNFDCQISRNSLRGAVELSTIIYSKSPGIPGYDEEHLYKDNCGYIVGELDKYILKLDGTSSMFPVYEEMAIGQPLWRVRCEWDDPTVDKFEESVSIYINKAHRNYKYLDKSKKTFDEQLLKEVMSGALTVLIMKLKQDLNYWDSTVVGNDLEIGSVSHAVNYFINTLGWSTVSPEGLSLSIRKFFDQRM